MRKPSRGYGYVSLLVAQWLAICVLAWPVGEFPISDDWAFVQAVRTLYDTGEVRMPDWSSMNFLSHLFWGALFALPLGMSYFALRVSGLVAGLLGVFVVYKLCRELGASRGLAWLAAAMLAANPIYFSLASSFMTDVPFAVMAGGSIWLYARALRTRSLGFEAAGTLLAMVAILSRQTGFAVPLAYAAALLVRDGINLRSVLRGMIVCALGVGTHLALRGWLAFDGQAPVVYGRQIEQVQTTLALPWKWLLVHLAYYGVVFWIYIGLACIVVLAAVLPDVLRREHQRVVWLVSSLCALAAAMYAGLSALGRRMPLLDNQVGVDGLISQLAGPASPSAALQFGWSVITLLGCLAAAWLGYAVLIIMRRAWRVRRQDPAAAAPVALILAFVFIYMVPVIGVSWLYDRYVVPVALVMGPLLCWLSPTFGPALQQAASTRAVAASLAVTLASLLTGLLAHDYFALQRARWAELDWLTRTAQVSPRLIAGGFEFNGLMNFSPKVLKRSLKGWWVDDDFYRLAVAEQPNYALLRERRFRTLLPFSPDRVLILRRDEGAAAR